MKRFKLELILAILLLITLASLAGCNALGPKTPASPSPPPEATPSPTSGLPDGAAVQQLMLESPLNWQSLHVVYRIETYSALDASAPPALQIIELWLRQPAEFKIHTRASETQPERLLLSDGKTILDNEGNRSELPAEVLAPYTPPALPADAARPHPLAQLLGTPVMELVFPTGLAQRAGEYRVTGQETFAGRPAIVVEWGETPGTLTDRLWVDEQSGIVLRRQNYAKDDSATPLTDVQATLFAVDREVPQGLFDLPSTPEPEESDAPPSATGVVAVSLPEVLNVRSGPGVDYTVLVTVQSGAELPMIGRRAANDWFKVVAEGKEGWVSALYVDVRGELDDVPVMNY